MKISNRKKQVLSVAIVLIASVMMVGFAKKNHNKHHSSRLLMVGVAYGQKKCSSGSFSEAIAYEFSKDCFDGNYSDMAKRIKSNLYNSYSVGDQNISIKSSSMPFAVIISYQKEIAGWGCSVKRYAVGFGDTMDEAQQNAILNKKTEDASSSYQFVTYFNCNN